MQYTQITITTNGKTVSYTTTTNQDHQNNSNNKKTPKKDRLREIYGDYHYGLFGDIHEMDYSDPGFRAFLWFQYVLVKGVFLVLWLWALGFCLFVIMLVILFLLSFIF
jgi:hypothetical protein